MNKRSGAILLICAWLGGSPAYSAELPEKNTSKTADWSTKADVKLTLTTGVNPVVASVVDGSAEIVNGGVRGNFGKVTLTIADKEKIGELCYGDMANMGLGSAGDQENTPYVAAFTYVDEDGNSQAPVGAYYQSRCWTGAALKDVIEITPELVPGAAATLAQWGPGSYVHKLQFDTYLK